MAEVVHPAPKKKSFAQRFHLSPYVYYDEFDPRTGTDKARASLSNLDYSPLKRVTLPSFVMGVLVSMGGFLYVFLTVFRMHVTDIV
jgi:hypothetical protein